MLVVQTEDTSDYVSQDRPVEANQQQEPGPPPYESVMMSGYDGVRLAALCTRANCSQSVNPSPQFMFSLVQNLDQLARILAAGNCQYRLHAPGEGL